MSQPAETASPMALAPELLEILVCPRSKAKLVYLAEAGVLVCPTSRLQYRIEAGVPVMLVDEAEELSEDAVQKLVAGL